MQFKCINFIDATVCKECLLQKFGDRDYGTFSKNEKDTVKAFNVLIEFIETGSIQPTKEATDFDGPIGELMINYLAFKTSQRLAKHTIDEYEQHLFRFLRFLKEKSVVSINTVNQLHIFNYIKSINPQTISLAHISIRTLRDFFKYLYAQGVLERDFSSMMPKDSYKSQAQMPSTYTVEEIEKLIAAVDRNNAVGKRDYAIIFFNDGVK
jgi:integrase